MENIATATAFFFRGHYKIDSEVLDKGDFFGFQIKKVAYTHIDVNFYVV
jgi:hypothetical protein